jgi:hypothetical protein
MHLGAQDGSLIANGDGNQGKLKSLGRKIGGNNSSKKKRDDNVKTTGTPTYGSLWARCLS